MASRSLFWFRRDLRLNDNPALLDAMAAGDETLLLFIMDEEIAARAGEYRRAYLADSLARLSEAVGGNLAVISGKPAEVLPDVVKRYGISSIHAAKEYAPYGVAAEEALAKSGLAVEYTGSNYAVAPGRVLKGDGTNYRVYTPFYRAWVGHGWRAPAGSPQAPRFASPLKGDAGLPSWSAPAGVTLQEAGEAAALARWKAYRKGALSAYDEARNIPSAPGTSRLSPHLRWGEIHPRTLLADLDQTSAHDVFRKEIAWREFYADVLHNYPRTSRDYYAPQYSKMRYDQPGEKFHMDGSGPPGAGPTPLRIIESSIRSNRVANLILMAPISSAMFRS